jgi:hypothetical protein
LLADLYKSSLDVQEIARVPAFKDFGNKDRFGVAHHQLIRVGIKLSPLYEIEIISLNFLLRVWREKMCMFITTDLLLANHSRNFPLYFGDAYIYDASSHLFQNISIMKKFRESDEFDEIKKKFDEKVPDNPEFLTPKLHHMRIKMDFAEYYLKLSETSLMFVEEHCGISFKDQLFRMIDGRINHLAMTQYVFDIVYGIYNLGLKHIFHCDLHLGNVTLHMGRTPMADFKGGFILHEMISKPKNKVFIYPDFLFYGCIIDFSQAIQVPLIKDSHEMFPFKQDIVRKYDESIMKFIKTYVNAPNIDSIRELLEDNAEYVYHAMICLDIIAFTDSFLKWNIWTDPSLKIKNAKPAKEINPDTDFPDTDGQTIGEHFAPTIKRVKKLNEMARLVTEGRFEMLLRKEYKKLVETPNPIPDMVWDIFDCYHEMQDVHKDPRYDPKKYPAKYEITTIYSPAHPEYLSIETLNYDKKTARKEVNPANIKPPAN